MNPSESEALAPGNNEIIDVIFGALGADDEFLELDDITSSHRPADTAPPTSSDSMQPWVLHVDDDEMLSKALSLRLNQYGIQVVRAFTGMDGVKHAFNNPADAIILDFEMPSGSGDYVLRRLKKNPVTADIPVIFLSGRSNTAIQRQLIAMGAQAFLTKPVEFPQLLAELGKHIRVQKP